MSPWMNGETADIVYHDKDRHLTKKLISAGHQKLRKFSGTKPQYFIEVKTTINDFKSDFYMNGGQYARVR